MYPVEDKVRWQLSNLNDPDNPERIGRGHPEGTWITPMHVWLEGSNLRWSSEGPFREVHSSPDLLDSFMDLGTADDATVLEFAQNHGVIPISARGLPIGWDTPGHTALRKTLFGPAKEPSILLRGAPEAPYAPISGVRGFADWCRSVLNLASRLHQGEPGRHTDWLIVDRRLADARGTEKSVQRKFYTVGESLEFYTAQEFFQIEIDMSNISKIDLVRQDKVMLASVLDRWLDHSDIRMRFAWPEGSRSPAIDPSPHSLVGHLVLCLAFAVSRTSGFEICSACGRSFTPKRRRQMEKRKYCSDASCQRRKSADAQQDARDRKRLEQSNDH